MLQPPVLKKEDYENAENLDALASLYRQKGLKVRSKRQAYNRAKKEWWMLNRKHDSGPVDELPGDCVEIGKVKYYVHGICHGDNANIPLGAQVKDFLRAEVDRLISSGNPVYVEDGLKYLIFKDKKVEQMNDIYVYFGNTGKVGKALLKRILMIPVTLPLLPFTDAIKEYRNYSNKMLRDLISSGKMAASNKNYIKDMQNASCSFFLPEHLEREWLEKKQPVAALVTCKRNEIMAKSMLKSSRRYKEVHAIVGAGHQNGIVYHLKMHGASINK